jgi:hypothetical protein
MQKLNFSKSNYQKLSQGKRTTIRLGSSSLTLGDVALTCDELMDGTTAEITEVRTIRLSDLGLMDAVNDGFNSVEELRVELESCYQKCVSMAEVITQVRFKV